MNKADFEITLTKAEVLVLFEFLSRYFMDNGELKIIDSSEEWVLSKIHGIFESRLVEPLLNNYQELLEEARSSLRNSEN